MAGVYEADSCYAILVLLGYVLVAFPISTYSPNHHFSNQTHQCQGHPSLTPKTQACSAWTSNKKESKSKATKSPSPTGRTSGAASSNSSTTPTPARPPPTPNPRWTRTISLGGTSTLTPDRSGDGKVFYEMAGEGEQGIVFLHTACCSEFQRIACVDVIYK